MPEILEIELVALSLQSCLPADLQSLNTKYNSAFPWLLHLITMREPIQTYMCIINNLNAFRWKLNVKLNTALSSQTYYRNFFVPNE